MGQYAAGDGYEGVTHAGIALLALDTGAVLLAQRALDETDTPDVRETWEFPGGGLDEGEDAQAGAIREWGEEVVLPLPEDIEVVNGWRSPNGVYQGFVVTTAAAFDASTFVPNEEVQAIGWFTREMIDQIENLRPEVRDQTDWDLIFASVSGNEDVMAASASTDSTPDSTEPEYTPEAFGLDGPIPVHGVVAPEEVKSGDSRGFTSGAMTRRPLRLPFRHQKFDIGGHDGAVTVGSVDRMMRKDGLIHWEGRLMESEDADELAARMQFFDGRYGVSVDGDQGSFDAERTEAEKVMWFDQVRAAGLTAVDIPAFHEAYVAFGNHPEMPAEDEPEALTAAGLAEQDIIGARVTFDRGPGWVTDPKATNRIHDYWTKKGQEGYAKVGWGTPGDFTRAKKLIGAKIAEHSPDKMRFLNQIIAQWHFDALGYWPGDLGKPGNAPDTAENRRRAAVHASLEEAVETIERDDIEGVADNEDAAAVWEAVLVSSAVSGNRKRPPLGYFHQHPSMVADPWAAESGALVVEDPDEFGFRRTWGYAAEWGVCHIGMNGRCVEPPRTHSDDYADFHLGRTKVEQEGGEGYVYTGVLTYGVGHRDGDTILSESPSQAYFDNLKNSWASVRVGENERGIWFSGVVLPKVDEDDLVKIEASGQVSGEWLRGEMRACLTVNVPGFPNQRPSAAYDAQGNVLALAASAFGANQSLNGVDDSECAVEARREKMAAFARIEAEMRFERLKKEWSN